MVNRVKEQQFEFMYCLLDVRCHKNNFSYDEYISIRDNPDSVLVRATILYDLYLMLVDRTCTRPEFNNLFKDVLYYDKYVCGHGVEYYYHIVFNKKDFFYNSYRGFIDKWIEVSGITCYNDVKEFIPAVSAPKGVRVEGE